MDFVRAAKLVNGKVLFVEPDPKVLEKLQNNHIEMIESCNLHKGKIIRKVSVKETQAQILKLKIWNRKMFPAKVSYLKS